MYVNDLKIYLKSDLRNIVDGLTFSLEDGDRLALIGEEGNGKSSILKAIYGEPDLCDYMTIEGSISKKGERLAYLPQLTDQASLDMTSQAYLSKHIAEDFFDYQNFYGLLGQMKLDQSRISDSLRLRDLSGGERVKFLLLVEMMKEPTVLLLDEPSNNLDLTSLIWLENFIKSLKIGVIFVSHDQRLVEECSNKIIFLEQLSRRSKAQHSLKKLGYSEFMDERAYQIEEGQRKHRKDMEEYQKKLDKYQRVHDSVQSQLRSVSRQAPSVAKNLKDKMHSLKSMEKRFEKDKEDIRENPDYEKSISLAFSPHIYLPSSKEVLSLELDQLRLGDRLLSKDIYLKLLGPEKIAITGDNGSGKTSLLKIILENISPDLRPGYMPQDYDQALDPALSPLEFLARDGSKEDLTEISSHLNNLNFKREEMCQKIGQLSGGQKAKLYFLKLILDENPVLVLDEPTRNLSGLSQEEIIQALSDYKGAIIAVSHDRNFIDCLMDKVYQLTPQGLKLV